MDKNNLKGGITVRKEAYNTELYEYDQKKLLQFGVEHGIIDLSSIRDNYEVETRKRYLEKQQYKIWKGKDGKWRTYLPDETKDDGRRLVKRSTQKDIEDVIVSYWKTVMENPTINEVFEEWADRKLNLNKFSAATHHRYAQVYRRHFGKFGKRHIKGVETSDIIDFLEEQLFEHELTAKAFANLKTITRGLLTRAKRRGLVNFNVEAIFQELDVSDIDFKKVIKEDYEEVFDEDETDLMRNYLVQNQTMTHLGILLMFVTGVRVGELVTLKRTDFDGNSFKVRRTETRYKVDGTYVCEVKEYPKTEAGVRTVVIPQDYAWIVGALLKYDTLEYVFEYDGVRMTAQSIRMRLKKICRKLKIYHKSPHKIRKTYGTILLDNNINKLMIIKQMGHTDIACTEKHYHRNRKTVEETTEIFSAISEFRMTS